MRNCKLLALEDKIQLRNKKPEKQKLGEAKLTRMNNIDDCMIIFLAFLLCEYIYMYIVSTDKAINFSF